ncbi:hypothetical protein LIER_15503 [Lithospermum erythrorhizon]|uniref:Uncharacterized protein n=1 Tax=Lithospermum erythrorhizon TaxID=34254 RepID=A0AAV3Q786_LITER
MRQPMHTPLTGFTGHSVYPMRMATLDFTLESGTKESIIRAQCTVVDMPDSCYNGLIGGNRGDKSQSEEGANVLSKIGSSIGQGARKAKKHSRENHPEVMSTQHEARYEEENSPKQRENLKRPVPHEEIVKVPFVKEEPEKRCST